MTDALPASVRATLEHLATRYAHDNPVWQLIADLLAQQGQRPEQQPPLAAQETAGWQPIASVTKDVTSAIVAFAQLSGVWWVGEAYRHTASDCWYAMNHDPEDPWDGPLVPTHWQLLPSPPAAQEGTD